MEGTFPKGADLEKMEREEMYFVTFRVSSDRHGEMSVTIPWADRFGSHARFSHPIPRDAVIAPAPAQPVPDQIKVRIGALVFVRRAA